MKIKAFTLIEALASIALITSIIIGPLTLMMNSIAYSRNAKDNLMSTLLAQEGVELIRNRRDSILISCLNSFNTAGDSTCTKVLVGGNGALESPGEASWRIFKEQMSTQGSSCIVDDTNQDGCAFDAYAFINNPLDSPVNMYSASSPACRELMVYEDPSDRAGMYACPASLSSGENGRYSGKWRSVKIEKINQTSPSTYDLYYSDDLKVTSHVTYTGPTGVKRTVTQIDYLRARP